MSKGFHKSSKDHGKCRAGCVPRRLIYKTGATSNFQLHGWRSGPLESGKCSHLWGTRRVCTLASSSAQGLGAVVGLPALGVCEASPLSHSSCLQPFGCLETWNLLQPKECTLLYYLSFFPLTNVNTLVFGWSDECQKLFLSVSLQDKDICWDYRSVS